MSLAIKEFYFLKYLFMANDMEWPFNKMDTPRVKEKPLQPVFSPEQIQDLILCQDKYSESERLYLSIATTWACRREAMALLDKRSLDNNSLTIPGIHGSATIKHLIPNEIKSLFDGYKLKEHTTTALSYMFHRIIETAGMDLPENFGWHSIRRTTATVIGDTLPLEKKMLLPLYTGWTMKSIGEKYFASAMAGYYYHPEILDKERGPFWVDTEVYKYNPFLKMWRQALKIPEVQLESGIAKKTENQPQYREVLRPATKLDEIIKKLKNEGY
jgi:hypothetical protein